MFHPLFWPIALGTATGIVIACIFLSLVVLAIELIEEHRFKPGSTVFAAPDDLNCRNKKPRRKPAAKSPKKR